MINYDDLNAAYRRRGKQASNQFVCNKYHWSYNTKKDQFETWGIIVRRNGDYIVEGKGVVRHMYASIANRFACVMGLYIHRHKRDMAVLHSNLGWITGDFRLDRNRKIWNKLPRMKYQIDKASAKRVKKYIDQLEQKAPFVDVIKNKFHTKYELCDGDLQPTPEKVALFKVYGNRTEILRQLVKKKKVLYEKRVTKTR